MVVIPFRRCSLLLVAICLVLGLLPLASSGAVQNVVFTIDSAASTLDYNLTGGTYAPYQPTTAGSNVSPVNGHFLVKFDPLSDVPATIQFVGGDGYFKPDNNVTMKSVNPGLTVAYDDLSWDFKSQVLTGTGGIFTAASTGFTVLSGALVETFASGRVETLDETGYTDRVTAGTWSLAQSAPGSGAWTLSVSGYYVPATGPQGASEKFTLTAQATAQFGDSNITTLAPTDTQANVLGGAATPGGVSLVLGSDSLGGSFSAQQIPSPTGLPQQAIAAAETNPIFAASTADLSLNPQIWAVDYNGLQAGQVATLVFHYDDSLLPAGLDESSLGIWHFDKIAQAWEFGGTVDPVANTITYVTDNFSPFQLGVAVPEPSAVALLSMGLLLLAGRRWRAVS